MFLLMKISTSTLNERFCRPNAWIDRNKTKVGYEIPFTRTFYEYKELEPAADIAKRIEAHEQSMMQNLHELFGNGGE